MALVEIDNLHITAFCDPKGANPNTKGSSRAAVVCVGMDSLERIFILQSWAAYCGADEILNRIFKFNAKWKPLVFGIDTTGTQNVWLNLINKEVELRQANGEPNLKKPPMRPVIFRGEKTRVIETIIQPRAARGQLFRPPEQEVKELASEFRGWPTAPHRDAMDALAHAIDLLPIRPHDESAEMQRRHYEHYLERIGIPKEERKQRLADIGRSG